MLELAELKADDLQKQLKTEQKLRKRAESSSSYLQESVTLAKENLQILKAAHEEEKIVLLKHAEEAEGKLEPVTQELNTLKCHITNMTMAIFGK
jgi:hypothetical protein